MVADAGNADAVVKLEKRDGRLEVESGADLPGSVSGGRAAFPLTKKYLKKQESSCDLNVHSHPQPHLSNASI